MTYRNRALFVLLLLPRACAAETIETFNFTISTGNADIPGQLVFRLEPDGTAGTGDIVSAHATAPPVYYDVDTSSGRQTIPVPAVTYVKENFFLSFYPDPAGCANVMSMDLNGNRRFPATDPCEYLLVSFAVGPNQPYGDLYIELDPYIGGVQAGAAYFPLPHEPSYRGIVTYSLTATDNASAVPEPSALWLVSGASLLAGFLTSVRSCRK